jgi:hypothetical protein
MTHATDGSVTLNTRMISPETINMRDHDGNTALHYAARSGNRAALSVLLGHGADPALANNSGLRESFPFVPDAVLICGGIRRASRSAGGAVLSGCRAAAGASRAHGGRRTARSACTGRHDSRRNGS